MECGFNDSNYFARQFRRILGVSPPAVPKTEKEIRPRPPRTFRTWAELCSFLAELSTKRCKTIG